MKAHCEEPYTIRSVHQGISMYTPPEKRGLYLHIKDGEDDETVGSLLLLPDRLLFASEHRRHPKEALGVGEVPKSEADQTARQQCNRCCT